MPIQFYVFAASSALFLVVSAYFLQDQTSRVKGLARVGLVFEATGMMLTAMYYFSVFIAVLIVVALVCAVGAWWSNLWDWF